MKTVFKILIFVLALTAFGPVSQAYSYGGYGSYGNNYRGNSYYGSGYSQRYNNSNPYQYQYRSYDYRIFSTRARPTYSIAPVNSYISYYGGNINYNYGNYYR